MSEINEVLEKLSSITGIDVTTVETKQLDTAVFILAKDFCERIGINSKNQRKKILKTYVPDNHKTRMPSPDGDKVSVVWLTLAGVYDLILYAPVFDKRINKYRARQSEELVQINHRDLGKAMKAKITRPIINKFL